jgi:hypothetical protein
LKVGEGAPKVAIGGGVGAADFGVGRCGWVDLAGHFGEFELAGAGVPHAIEREAFADVGVWEGFVEVCDEQVEGGIDALGGENWARHGVILSGRRLAGKYVT